jgi:hypothetical protein
LVSLPSNEYRTVWTRWTSSNYQEWRVMSYIPFRSSCNVAIAWSYEVRLKCTTTVHVLLVSATSHSFTYITDWLGDLFITCAAL